jgi:phosphonate transport system substrate-binding protein
VDADTAEKVREALLALSDRDFVAVNGERLNVLHRNGTKGYVPARDEEFDILRKMARAANLPPYEKY